MGVPREDGFDITAASEVMAILCLANDYADLKTRLSRILAGFGRDGTPVYAGDLQAHGAIAALLRDAMLPNLVQTTEGAPAIVHGGPLGNIAHGCNSVIATRLLRADIVFTEAGFGFDLGAEKFLDIKCRSAGFWPHAIVLVVTVRALKVHGGAQASVAAKADASALERGMENLYKHLESIRHFGIEPIVVVNRHDSVPPDEIAYVVRRLGHDEVDAGAVDVFARGGDGGVEIAERILARVRAATPRPQYVYELTDPPEEKVRRIARAIYGAEDVAFSVTAEKQLARAEALGLGGLPICIAKTHLSLSDDERLIGRPRAFDMTVREVRIAAGAGFLVPLTGEITTMPGLAKRPNAANIDLLPDGTIVGIQALNSRAASVDAHFKHADATCGMFPRNSGRSPVRTRVAAQDLVKPPWNERSPLPGPSRCAPPDPRPAKRIWSLEKFGRRIDCELQIARYANRDWWICDEDGWCLYRSHGADLAEAFADARDGRWREMAGGPPAEDRWIRRPPADFSEPL